MRNTATAAFDLAAFTLIAFSVLALLAPMEAARSETTTTAPAQRDAPLQTTAQTSIEIDQHKLFELTAGFDIPEGHQVVSSNWQIPADLDTKQCTVSGRIGTGAPGTYKVELAIQTAETYDVETPDGPREAILLPIITRRHSWDITIRGPPVEQPPTEENPEQPAPEGVRNAVILYPLETSPPIEAEAATGLLRKEGTPVFFSAAGSPSDSPAYLATAYEAAFQTGLPALVVMDGATVNRSLKLPEDTQAIIDEVNKP